MAAPPAELGLSRQVQLAERAHAVYVTDAVLGAARAT